MKRNAFLIAASVAIALAHGVAWADAPNLLNYQGRLTDPSGNPKNGTFSMTFAIYDAATGGNQLPSGTPWSEAQNVTVTNGVFNVLLGSVTPLPASLFTGGPTDSAGPLRFLQVTVGVEALVPRQRVASAAYALGASGTAAVPVGGIILWDQSDNCPPGFVRVSEFDGRHLVGSNSPNVNQGQDFVTLTIGQMPAHTHPYGDTQYGGINNNPGVLNNFSHTVPGGKTTGDAGGGQPFDNRPAGRTILLCRNGPAAAMDYAGSTHTTGDCEAAGGTVTSVAGDPNGTQLCKFTGTPAALPPGWLESSWQAWAPVTGSAGGCGTTVDFAAPCTVQTNVFQNGCNHWMHCVSIPAVAWGYNSQPISCARLSCANTCDGAGYCNQWPNPATNLARSEIGGY